MQLGNGQVLAAGGSGGLSALGSAELYDPATGNWTATGSLGTARHSWTATRLGTGLVVIAGGATTGDVPVASAELYYPFHGAFTNTGSMPTARARHAAIGRVLVTGCGTGSELFR